MVPKEEEEEKAGSAGPCLLQAHTHYPGDLGSAVSRAPYILDARFIMGKPALYIISSALAHRYITFWRFVFFGFVLFFVVYSA